MTLKIKIKVLPGGKKPEYKRTKDACMDCYARVENPIVIKPGEIATIPLGFKCEIPEGYKGHVKPRSGLMTKGKLCGLGTIECTYRGELGAIILNLDKEPFIVNNGDRVGQFEVIEDIRIEWEEVDELSESERGEAGFGSSGIN